MTDPDQLRYPIGRFQRPGQYDEKSLQGYITEIRHLPANLEIAVQSLDAWQLQTPYRQDGWTVQQVVHHIPDSHMNAYMRFKLALTEETPGIKTYKEDRWAALPDTSSTPVNISLTLLHALHARWVHLLEGMRAADFDRTLFHPEQERTIPLKEMLAMYAWHGQHHLMHIIRLKERMGWK